MENEKETYLADWLAGNLTDDQLREKVSDDDFNAYQKLRNSIDSLQLHTPDLEKNYSAIKQKKIAALDKSKPVRVIKMRHIIAVAASILALIGLYNVFVFSTEMQTGIGDQLGTSLADNSLVELNSNSTVSYPGLFVLNRKIKLEGEAFFQVSKGRKFTVQTKIGEVTVLGTKFNVVARDGIFEVICHEGRVKVCVNDTETILTRGDAFRFYAGKTETWTAQTSEIPTWKNHESTFYKMPVRYVIAAIENQYGSKIDYPENLENVRFTGGFTHKNLATALESVCAALNLKYTQSDGKITISE